MQEIRIEGYVGKDPQIRESKSRKYAQFSVGCSAKTNRRDNNGNDIYETTWYNVYAKPEEVNGIFKGTRVLVTGFPKYSMYTANDGQNKIDISIAGAKIYISTYVSEKNANNQQTNTTQPAQQPKTQQPTPNDMVVDDIESDDLPF